MYSCHSTFKIPDAALKKYTECSFCWLRYVLWGHSCSVSNFRWLCPLISQGGSILRLISDHIRLGCEPGTFHIWSESHHTEFWLMYWLKINSINSSVGDQNKSLCITTVGGVKRTSQHGWQLQTLRKWGIINVNANFEKTEKKPAPFPFEKPWRVQFFATRANGTQSTHFWLVRNVNKCNTLLNSGGYLLTWWLIKHFLLGDYGKSEASIKGQRLSKRQLFMFLFA